MTLVDVKSKIFCINVFKLYFSIKKGLFINLGLAWTVKVRKSAMLRHVLSFVAACSVKRHTRVEDTEIKSEKEEKEKCTNTQTCSTLVVNSSCDATHMHIH